MKFIIPLSGADGVGYKVVNELPNKTKGWIKIVKESPLPNIGEDVYVFYTIPESETVNGKTTSKKTGKFHRYRTVARVNEIRIFDSGISVEWLDSEHQVIDPEFWHPLPNDPI